MILCGGHGDGGDAVAEREQRDLLAEEALLQHDSGAGRTECAVDEDRADGRFRFGPILGQ